MENMMDQKKHSEKTKYFLAWDTSQKEALVCVFSVCFFSEKTEINMLSSWSFSVDQKKHSERLLWGIDQVLKGCDLSLQKMDGFGVGVGPGSFTGLRVGIATARAIAFFLKKPLFGVSSLAPFLSSWIENPCFSKSWIVFLRQAWRGEAFAVVGQIQAIRWQWKQDFPIVPVEVGGFEQGIWNTESFFKKIQKKINKDETIYLGWNGFLKKDLLKIIFKEKMQKIKFCEPFFLRPSASALAYLVWQKAKMFFQEKTTQTLPLQAQLDSVLPQYWRASHAVLKLQSGDLKKAPLEIPDFLKTWTKK